MQKKIEAELMSLAHRILKLKKGDDIKVLKEKAHEVYEKLSVLDYITTYVRETPQNTKSVDELIQETFSESAIIEEPREIMEPVVDDVKPETEVKEERVVEEMNEVVSEKIPELFSKEEVSEKSNLQSSLEKEFENTVSLDVATDLFENAARVPQKKSVNDVIMSQRNLQIDLNDRIAFVKNLFNGSQEEFNRVISQLNTMSSKREALSLMKMVKREYNWDGQEVYEERLLILIERKFN